jgi:hypothetical protein
MLTNTIKKSKQTIDTTIIDDTNNFSDLININKLKKYLIDKYGNQVIIESEDVPDKDPMIYINKLKLYDITYKTFLNIKSIYNENYITMDQLINFLLDRGNGGANTNATCGKYHEFMSMVHELCDVTIDTNGMPNYKNINKNLRYRIIPQRQEYDICWWIIYMVSNDSFIKQFLFVDGKNMAFPTFQRQYCDRSYDICFENLDIMIEIQEDNCAHKNNPNDILKESIIKFGAKRIKYFKLKEYNSKKLTYQNDFWENVLKKSIIESLLYKKYESRKLYCLYRFIEICKYQYTEITKELLPLLNEINNGSNDTLKIKRTNKLVDKIKGLKLFIDSPKQTLIYKLFEWRDEAEKKNNEYIICVSDIARLFGFNASNINEFYDIIYEEGCMHKSIYVNNKRIMYISWQTLVDLIRLKDINSKQIKITQYDIDEINNYLNHIEQIYEEIIIKLTSHSDEIINNIKYYNEQYIEHIKSDIEKPHFDRIKSLQFELDITKSKISKICLQIHKLTNITKQQIDITNSLSKYKKDSKYIPKMNELNKLLEQFYSNNVAKNITIQKKKNSSIIKEMPWFLIVYTGDPNDKITITDFEAICHLYKITQTNCKKIKEELYCDYNIDINKITILHGIKDITNNDNITDEAELESGIGSDSGSGLEQRFNQQNIDIIFDSNFSVNKLIKKNINIPKSFLLHKSNDDSSIEDIKLDDDSSIEDINFNDDSSIDDIKLEDDSSINNYDF